jgi:pyruvate,water dikinase
VLLDLIIQHFVPASVGGVLFTVDPWTRDASAFIVEAARGGPHAVVAGAAPDLRLRVPRDGGRPAASGATELLAHAHVDRLRRVGLRLEALFAGHQDIEWLLAGDTLHVVQARDAG